MSEESQILIAADSGTQTVIPQLAMSAPQVVYLDFDGAETSYNGELLTIDNVVMEDSGFDDDTITLIVAALNEQFGDDVVFTADIPQTDEYSTIYIGVTSAFEAYGDFLGLAETIDSGNQIHDDNAFVFLNSATATELVTSVIAHETEHIVHGMEHKGEGIDRYTAVMTISGTNNVFRISSGETLNVNNSVIEYSVNGSGQIWPCPVFQVLAGGILTNATLKREEYFGYTLTYSALVQRDGAAYGITVSGGVLEVQDYTNLHNITFSSGDFNLLHGGENVFFHGNNYVRGNMGVEGVYIQNDAKFYVQSGGVMNSTTVNSGLSIGSGKDEGYLVVNNGGEVYNTILNSAGWLELYKGGVAYQTIINSSGVMNLWSGGTANGVILNPGGYLDIWEGGSALNIKENGGTIVGVYVDLDNNPDITFVPNIMVGQIFSGNYSLAVTLHSGTTVLSSLIQKSACVYSGGLIESSINSGGSIEIANGGIVNAVENQRGNIGVYDGGLVKNTICSSGNVWLFDGGSAHSVTVVDKGSLTLGGIFVGSAIATATTVCSGGSMNVGGGGGNFVVISTFINSNGLARIKSGGTGSNTFVDYGGKCYVSGSGLLKNTMISSGGTLVISSAGTASSIFVDHVGKCYVGNGGMLDNAVVSSNGSLIVSSNAVLRGTIVIGGSMTLEGAVDASGASITFDIAQRMTSDTAVVNSISAIDSGTYSIRVATDQTEGQYKLAGNAADFDQTVTLTVKDTDLTAELTKGVTTTVNGMEYTLDTVDGVLSLNVEAASVGSTYVSQTVSSGSMVLSNGDSAVSTTILAGGNVIVSNGGVADKSMVGSQGYLLVSEGGVANSTTVSSAGWMYVYNGGTANETTVLTAGGALRSLLYLYGVANSTTLGSGGGLVVSKGGFANSVTVQSGGYLSVSSGGTATAVNAAAGASANLLVAPDTYVAGTSDGKAFQITDVVNAMEIGRSMTLKVIAGGTASSISVVAGGSLAVSNGFANSVTVQSGGYLSVSSGGTATAVNAAAGASANLLVAPDTYVAGTSDGKAFQITSVANAMEIGRSMTLKVIAGGTASSISVDAGGSLAVSSGGTALRIREDGGYVYAYEGATVTFVPNVLSGLIVENDDVSLHSGTTAVSTTVNSGGRLYVFNGGDASLTTVNSSGGIYVSSGGTATSTTVHSSGFIQVTKEGAANSTTVGVGGKMVVYSGGVANEAVVDSTGELWVSGNGTATSATVLAGGSLIACNSGVLNDAVVSSAGWMVVFSNGTANSTTIEAEGLMAVRVGGTANSTMVQSGGYLVVSSNGTANETTIHESGRMWVFSSGVANSTTINAYGGVIVSSCGTAYFTDLASGGYLLVSNGGTGVSTNVGSLGQIVVSEGGMVISTTLSGSYIYPTFGANIGNARLTVLDGGQAQSTTIASGGYLRVSSGGAVDVVTVEDGGILSIDNGGTALNVRENGGAVNCYGDVHVTYVSNIISGVALTHSTTLHSGTTAVSATFDGGYLEVYSGGVADSIEDKAHMIVYDGGLANSTKVNYAFYVSSGGIANATLLTLQYSDNGMFVSNGGVANQTTISYGGLVVKEGGVANQTTIVGSRGRLVVEGGGTANSTIVESTSQFYGLEVSSGGTANGIVVKRGGSLSVACGGIATGIEAESNTYLSFGIGSNTYIQGVSGGMAFAFSNVISAVQGSICWEVGSGGTAIDMAVSSTGDIVVSDGGLAISTTLYRYGDLGVYSGGTAVSTTVGYYGYLAVGSGGTANAVLVSSGGSLFVGGDGAVADTVLQSGAWLGVELTSETAFSVMSGGSLLAFSNGASSMNVHSNFKLSVSNGGTAYLTTVASKGVLGVYNSGTVNSTTVKTGGSMFVYRYGSANATVVEQGGWISAFVAATLNSTVVNSGGSLVLSSGVVLKGTTLAGGTMTLLGAINATDANIMFDITQRTKADGVIVNDMTLLDATEYSVSVAADQTAGLYKLAGNAADFEQSVTLTVKNSALTAQLSKDVTTTVGGKDYTLSVENGNLCLTVAGDGLPAPRNLSGDDASLSWSVVEGASGYVVEYSQDNFATCVKVETASVGMEHYNVGAGTWQWRVRTIEGTEWAVGNDITISAPDTSPSVVSASANGVKDVFFVKPNGVWSDAWMAEHMGVHGEWAGTGETVVFGGENRFGDIFQGSTDENILLLTDDANGDALFVYDIYTESKDDLAKFQNRLSDIKEIHAGAGDDIVDLTSDEFDYTGGGLSIHGGLGDDTIWANAGDNTLFGDAGSDRLVGAGGNDVIVGGVGDDSMHGGGGNDIFAFGDIDWGNDTVEQLPGGDFRLWFAEGMKLGNANGDIKLALDGGDTVVQRVGTSNTVRVKGLANAEVSSRLIFGSGTYNGLDYSSLSAMGAFSPFGTERVFDEKNRGMLA